MSEVIGENNSEHFFVATQDAELRKKFKEVSYCKRKYDLPVFHATYIFEELNFLFYNNVILKCPYFQTKYSF